MCCETYLLGTGFPGICPGSETKKFVNIAAGGHGSVALKRLMGELQAAGFGQPGDGSYHLVPAPLLVATARGGRSASLMPMGSQTIYGKIGGYLGKAASAVAASGDDPDFHIPTAQLATALWGSHSLRRLSDGVVRDYCTEVFAQLGGAMIITRAGGDAFVLQDRDDNFYCRVAGAPGVKIMHPSLSQAIPLADMRSYMGFVPAIYTREWHVNGFPAHRR